MVQNIEASGHSAESSSNHERIVSSRVSFPSIHITRTSEGKFSPDVSRREVVLRLKETPPEGWAIVEAVRSGLCTSEITYYHSDRAVKYGNDLQKMRETFDRRVAPGLVDGFELNEEELRQLTETPNHEGIGMVVKSTSDLNQPTRKFRTFIPQVEEGKFLGIKPTDIDKNFGEGIEAGTMVAFRPAISCDQHLRADPIPGIENTGINSETGMPYPCTKETNGHLPKDTFGHENHGLGIDGKMPYSLDSMVLFDDRLTKWIEEKDSERRLIAGLFAEPLGCAFEAQKNLIKEINEGKQPPNVIVIWGQSVNAYLNAMLLRAVAPDAKILIVGRNKVLLEHMEEGFSDDDNVSTVFSEGGESTEAVVEAIRKVSNGGQERADVLIPTVALPDHMYGDVVQSGGRVIEWAASKTTAEGSHTVYPFKVEKSYGGLPGETDWGMELLGAYAENQPEVLEHLVTYPLIMTIPSSESSSTIEEWIETRGRVPIQLKDGKSTSAKIVIKHNH